MKKQIMLLSLVILLSLTFVIAIEEESYVFKKDTNNTLKVYCFNNVSGFCDVTVSCNINIQKPDSSELVNNQSLFHGGGFKGYNLTADNLNESGQYSAFGVCTGTNSIPFDFKFLVTQTGVRFTIEKSIVYASIFVIIIFLFIVNFFAIGLLPQSNEKTPEGEIISISLLKYLRSVLWFVEWILLITILFLSSNLSFAYLGEQLFANTLFVLFRITFGLTPVIVIIWFAWIFVQIWQDKEMKKLMDRGFIPQHQI